MPNQERIGGGFTEGELTFASFWVRHRLQLRVIGRGVLIGVNALLWGYVLWGLLDAYAISYPREKRIIAEIAQNQFLASTFENNRPQSVQTGGVEVFQSTDDRLDFIIQATNPNKEWWASFTYQFNVSGEQTPARSGFILPGQRLYLGEFGFKPKTKGVRSGVLTVDNLRWHRLDPGQVGADFEEWVSRRNQFRMDDVTFSEVGGTSGSTGAASTASRTSRTSFTFVNPSAYGFWSVRLYVVLKRGSAPVAATTITLDHVKSGEERPVQIDWFEKLPSVTETEIVPVVNFLDTSQYLPTTQVMR